MFCMKPPTEHLMPKEYKIKLQLMYINMWYALIAEIQPVKLGTKNMFILRKALHWRDIKKDKYYIWKAKHVLGKQWICTVQRKLFGWHASPKTCLQTVGIDNATIQILRLKPEETGKEFCEQPRLHSCGCG